VGEPGLLIYNSFLISLFKYGSPSALHHFLTALSETPYILPISQKDLILITSNNSSLEGLFTFLFSSPKHSKHKEALREISLPHLEQ
jgi:hypothetical protein